MSIYRIPDLSGDRDDGVKMEPDRKIENIEEKFVKELSTIICDIMNVNYKDREMFKSLLYNSLKGKISNRSSSSQGLLQQYLSFHLDKLGNSLKASLNIPDKVKINHNYSTAAKFSHISKYIIDNYYTDAAKIFKNLENGKARPATYESEGEVDCGSDEKVLEVSEVSGGTLVDILKDDG